MKFYNDFGDKYFTYGHEYGATMVISADSNESAHSIAIDESPAIDKSDLPDAYGFYLMQCCKYNDKNSNAKWAICSDHESHGVITSENILFCTGDRRTIGGLFDSKESAQEYCLKYISDNEIDLTEGYQYQSNATDTGIVNSGHYEWIRESNADEITAFEKWLETQED